MITSLVFSILILITTSTLVVTITQSSFIKGTYDNSTMLFTVLPEIDQPMSFMTCSFACLRSSKCTGFKFQGPKCNLTNNIPVKAIESSENKINLWLSSKVTPVPHILLIDAGSTGNGEIYDFSTSESLSLHAKFKMTWPKPSKGGPFILSANGSLRAWPIFTGSNKSVEWNIGESAMTQTNSDLSEIMITISAGWASIDEIMFIIGVGSDNKESWGYVDSKWKKLKSFSKELLYTCATFIPGDTDSVYFMGGCNDASLYKYSFEHNSYSAPHVDESKIFSFLSCTGYMDAGGYQYFVKVGGTHQSVGKTSGVQLFCTNCNSPGWTSLPNYPLPIISSSSIVKDGIKLDLRSSLQWTQFSDLKSVVKRSNVYVVPYG